MPDSQNNRTLAFYSYAFALGAIFLGTLVTVGGHPRFSSASFVYLNRWGGPYFWGPLLIGSGLSAVAGQYFRLRWPFRLGHNIAGMAQLFWAGAFCAGAHDTPTGPWTGIGAYLLLGSVHCVAAGITPSWARHGYR